MKTIIAALACATCLTAIPARAAPDDGRLPQGPIKTATPYPPDVMVPKSDMARVVRTFSFWTLVEDEYIPDGRSTAVLATYQPLSNGEAISIQIGNRAEDNASIAIITLSKNLDQSKPIVLTVGDAEVRLSKPQCEVGCAYVMPGKTFLSMLPVSPSKDRLTLTYTEQGQPISVPVLLEGLPEAIAGRSQYHRPFEPPR